MSRSTHRLTIDDKVAIVMNELCISSDAQPDKNLSLTVTRSPDGADPYSDLILNDVGSIVVKNIHLWSNKYGCLLALAERNHAVESNCMQRVIDFHQSEGTQCSDATLMIVRAENLRQNVLKSHVKLASQHEPILSICNVSQVQQNLDEEIRTAQDVNVDCVSSDRRSDRKIFFIQLVVAVVILVFAWLTVFKSPKEKGVGIEHDSVVARAGSIASAGDNEGNSVKRYDNDAVAPAATLTPNQLRQNFRKKLADASLIGRFNLKLEDQSWLMHAELDDEETPRFERVLLEFLSEYKVSFPVNAQIVRADSKLPFKIQQVVSGTDASVVTRDGQRIRVGDEYLGVRLMAIKHNRVTFNGKRKIEVRW